MRVTVIPIGVTREIVERIFKDLMPADIMVSITVQGYEDVKKPILDRLRELAKLFGATYFYIVSVPGDILCFTKLLSIHNQYTPDEAFLVGTMGSRYLFLSVITTLLKYWRDTGVSIYILSGIEGESYSVQPLPGFFSTAMRLSKIQRHILEITYGFQEPLSWKDLKEKYKFTHSVYTVLRDMERKGLLIIRQNRIEKTFPRKFVYSLMKSKAGMEEHE